MWKGLLILSLFPVVSIARIISIPQDYSTIQHGIDVSWNGDTALVAPGMEAAMKAGRPRSRTTRCHRYCPISFK